MYLAVEAEDVSFALTMIYQSAVLHPAGENDHHARLGIDVDGILGAAPLGTCISVHGMERTEKSVHTVLGHIVHVAGV